MITITIPGEPVAQGRPRAFKTPGGFIRTYDPKKSRDWKGTAQVHMTEALRQAGERLPAFSDGPLELHVVAVFSCPASRYRKGTPRPREPHAKRPDGDNVLKAVQDAAEGVLYARDAQIARAVVDKVTGAQGEAPRVEVVVRPYRVTPALLGLPLEERAAVLKLHERQGAVVDAC